MSTAVASPTMSSTSMTPVDSRVGSTEANNTMETVAAPPIAVLEKPMSTAARASAT